MLSLLPTLGTLPRVQPSPLVSRRLALGPDLLPVGMAFAGQTFPISFCRLTSLPDGSTGLVVTIRNQGLLGAPAFITRVLIGNSMVDRAMGLLAAGADESFVVRIPPGSFHPDLSFRIIADVNNVVADLDRTNNTATGVCIG